MRKFHNKKSRSKYLILLMIFVFFASYFSLFFGRVVQVNSKEMAPSFEQGELLWLKKQDQYHLGDVVLVEFLDKNQYKQYSLTRIVGVAQDQIELKNGEVWRNGKMLRSSKPFFLRDESNPQDKQSIWWEKIGSKEFPVIGKDLYVYWSGNMAQEEVKEYFGMCDYRLLCMSATHQISTAQIIGKIDARWVGFADKTQKSLSLFDIKGNRI
jgi:signal peptidase I